MPVAFFFCVLAAAGQNMQISSYSELIEVREDTSFTRQINIFLKQTDIPVMYPIIYDSELEKVSGLTVSYKSGKRYKQEKSPVIAENVIDTDVVSSKKLKSIAIPPGTEAQICYAVSCPELMYFSNLQFFSYDNIDTLKYEVIVPNSFRMVHDIVCRDSLSYLVLDSIQSEQNMRWKIEVAPQKIQPDALTLLGIYKNMSVPLMRILVVPANYPKEGEQYLKDWYLGKLESTRGLSPEVKAKIDELTQGITDQRAIMDTLYNYIRSNFKYVAIEIGMGAFIPSDVNEVFTNKHGDCKDLSNLLSDALKYKGIKSTVAMASTHDNIADCNFPSIGSANHIICVAYIDDQMILLDPTDPLHVPGKSIQAIQGRSIFIFNPDGGFFYDTGIPPAADNLLNYEIDLTADSEHKAMNGVFNARYGGISGNFLKAVMLNQNEDKRRSIGEDYYEDVFGNQRISDLKIQPKGENGVEISGNLAVNGKILTDNQNLFLFVDFLPPLLENEPRDKLTPGTYLGNTLDKKVKLRIKLGDPVESFSPIEKTFTKDDISVTYSVSSLSESEVECKYEFQLGYILVNKENIARTNEILKYFKKLTNDPILLKLKN
ncbi:transglutaminase superfamily protein [Mangrovibacterium diazotrophicum]|uniref:Transglutaminase superfamily protein n=1 Tax=Mangrovibacterium diazotrophicum TaxID=1261403 RepID=A0A419W6M3_9BACT|nr:transglutaminase superfamily protein [Mangrovibacterium diazotrophicum]